MTLNPLNSSHLEQLALKGLTTSLITVTERLIKPVTVQFDRVHKHNTTKHYITTSVSHSQIHVKSDYSDVHPGVSV